MKKILFILSFLVSFLVTKSQEKHTAYANRNAPSDTAYGTHRDTLGSGGLHTYLNSTTRDSLPYNMRRIGMVSYTSNDSTYWRWDGSAWILLFKGDISTKYATKQFVRDSAIRNKSGLWDNPNANDLTYSNKRVIVPLLAGQPDPLLIDKRIVLNYAADFSNGVYVDSKLDVADSIKFYRYKNNANTPYQYLTVDSSGNVKTDEVKYGIPLNYYPHIIDTGDGGQSRPWGNSIDSAAGIQTTINSYISARLINGRYNITKPVVARNTLGDYKTIDVEGTFSTIMYPNAEGEIFTGTRVYFDTVAFKLGTLDFANLPRPGRPTLSSIGFWGNGRATYPRDGSFRGSAVLVDGAVDQMQIKNCTFGNCIYGFANTGSNDAATITNCSFIGNRYPIYFDSTALVAFYDEITHCTIADNLGPIVLKQTQNQLGWYRISNCVIASNGRENLAEGVPNCNIYISANNCIISDSWITNAGYSNLYGTRIPADGIVITGRSNRVTDCVIAGQPETGMCGIRVKSGAVDNVINCNFRMYVSGYVGNYRDVIIESGAVNTTLYVYPGMTYIDNGTNTIIIPVVPNLQQVLTSGNVGSTLMRLSGGLQMDGYSGIAFSNAGGTAKWEMKNQDDSGQDNLVLNSGLTQAFKINQNGTINGKTESPGTNSTALASTAFVQNAIIDSLRRFIDSISVISKIASAQVVPLDTILGSVSSITLPVLIGKTVIGAAYDGFNVKVLTSGTPADNGQILFNQSTGVISFDAPTVVGTRLFIQYQQPAGSAIGITPAAIFRIVATDAEVSAAAPTITGNQSVWFIVTASANNGGNMAVYVVKNAVINWVASTPYSL